MNHSNIAIVHGLERIDDGRALVMELVEGPTLADRIAQGPLPLDEAIPIARRYDVSPDGQEFLINSLPRADAAAPLSLIVNWEESGG